MVLKGLKQHIKFISRLSVARILKRRVPLIAVLCVTNRCNLNCWYCYGEHSYRGECREFTTDELLDIVRTLHNLGTQILQLQGGEPLLRNDLPVIINEARGRGMSCDMVTNGTLILDRPEVIQLLDKICISLDGPPDTNNRNRGAGTYDRIIKGIEYACLTGLAVRISTVLTASTTIDDIDWLVSFAGKYNVLLNFSPPFEFTAHFHSSEFRHHVIPDENMRLLLRHIINHKRKNAPIQFSAVSYNIAMKWPYAYQKKKANSCDIGAGPCQPKCYHGDYVVFIDSDGSVYPCCNFWGRPKWNIRKHGLQLSVRSLERDGCQACHIPAYIDRNLFFSYRPSVWWNYVIQAVRGLL